MSTGKAKLLADFVHQQTATPEKLQGRKPVKQSGSKPVRQDVRKSVEQQGDKVQLDDAKMRATFYVYPQPFKQMKLKAVQLERDYSDCMREAMEDWLKKH